MSRIAVIGLGNVLMGDDGFGPYVAHLLDGGYEWPEDVQVVELGTQGLDLTPYVNGLEALVVVSTVHRDGAPRTLHRLPRAEILGRDLPNPPPPPPRTPY